MNAEDITAAKLKGHTHVIKLIDGEELFFTFNQQERQWLHDMVLQTFAGDPEYRNFNMTANERSDKERLILPLAEFYLPIDLIKYIRKL